MDNILSKGLLLTVATALVGYGVTTIYTNFWYGFAGLVVGALVFVGREVLKQKGYNVGSKK